MSAAAAEPAPLRRVVSVSLGSSSRDKTVTARLGDQPVELARRGVDGDLQRAIALIREFDGTVDAIGLGGIDLYLAAAGRRYVIRDAAKMAAAATRTPVLDGSGLKHTVEREALRRIDESGEVPLAGRTALLVSGVDRFGMAETLWERCGKVIYGDLMFNLGLPIPIRSLRWMRLLARLILPWIVKLPFTWLYPTGEKQTAILPKWEWAYREADIIAGDFLLIRRHLPPPGDPPPLAGKVILTNTTTAEDVELLRERGAAVLVTTTPEFDGRTFGTNVLEACFTALAGATEPLPPERLMAMLDELDWSPNVVRLAPAEPQETPPS